MINYHTLLSGSDLRGVATGENPEMNPVVAARVGEALCAYVRDTTGISNPRIVVGRDPRETGIRLLDAMMTGLKEAGARATDFGLCTTPAMFIALGEDAFGADAAVMITASHLPANRNGIKIMLPGGGIDPETLEEILQYAESDVSFSHGGGETAVFDFLPVYKETLKTFVQTRLNTDVQKPLLGLHVVVDAGNGSGGFYAELLEEMGAWIEGSQFLNPDGTFPNHIPNPENAEACASLRQAVLQVGADLGVIFDADCDRAALVDASGREINRNRLIALVSAILLNQKSGLTIVTDSVTSSGLTKFIGEWGGVQYRYKRGYRNVIDQAIKLNESGVDCPLAIETSGHAAFRENHFLDDGMYLSTLLICEAMILKQEGKTLSDLICDLKEPLESAEIRLKITGGDFRAAGRAAIEKVMDYAFHESDWHIAPDNREGVRISFDLDGQLDNAWFLLRLSVHDPVLPLNLESDVPGGVRRMAQALANILSGCDDLDLQPLHQYLQGGKNT